MGAEQPRGMSREELLELADELLAQVSEMRRRWVELHDTLRGHEPEASGGRGRRGREPRESEGSTDPRHLVAVDMMLAGRSRAEVEDHLRREYGDEAAAEVLAQVYADSA